MRKSVCLCLLLAFVFSCKKQSAPATGEQPMSGNVVRKAKPTIVYKTKKDYYYNVPVQLDENKKNVVSYPAVSDIKKDTSYTYPTKLLDGYLLDNRGIGINTVFLKYTYEEYSKLKDITPEVLYKAVLDKDPFLEIYDLGARTGYPDIPKDINRMIKDKKLGKFERIK